MKKTAFVLLTLLLIICLSACTQREDENEAEYTLYYINSAGTGLTPLGYDSSNTSADSLVAEFIENLSKAPQSLTLKKLLPDQVMVTNYVLSTEHVLTLYFSTEYNSLDNATEVLLRAAIVKDFCQIDGVEYVQFYVGDMPLMKSADSPRGLMKAEDFVDNTGEASQYIKVATLMIYFADETGEMLEGVNLRVEYTGNKSQEQLVMEQLIAGPSEALSGYKRTLSDATVVNKITTQDGICYLDLNGAGIEFPEDISSDIGLYSIVNSLTEITSISKVQISVDGTLLQSIDSVSIPSLLERKLEYIKE